MKRIALLTLILTVFFSCSHNNLIEDVLTRHEDGSKKEVRYYKENKDGSKDCVRETWYYEEGMVHLDGPIFMGKRNGEFKTYYKSGELMSKGTFVDGIREGEAFTYYENGNVKYYGMYKNGKECGIWKFYDENGEFDHETNRDLR